MPTDISTGHTVNLSGRQQVADGTMAFHFEKPNAFDFRAGRAIDITQLNPPETDSEGNIRTYGGNGTTNFALPNLPGPRDASGNQLTWIICLQGIFPERS